MTVQDLLVKSLNPSHACAQHRGVHEAGTACGRASRGSLDNYESCKINHRNLNLLHACAQRRGVHEAGAACGRAGRDL